MDDGVGDMDDIYHIKLWSTGYSTGSTHRVQHSGIKCDKGRYVCQIRNEYGLKAASFNIVKIASLLDSIERPIERNTTGYSKK